MKRRAISLYLKEMFITPNLYISIFLVAAIVLLGCYIEGGAGTVNLAMDHITADNFTKNVACIPAALPVIVTFCDDCKHQYLRPLVTRCGVRKYTLGKYIAGLLSAFLTVALGLILAMTVLSAFYPLSVEPSTGPEDLSLFGKGAFGRFETMGLPALTFITRSLIFAAYAAVYALFGLVVSAFIPNKFLTLAVPFAASFMVQEVCFHLLWLPTYLNLAYLQTASELFKEKSMLFNALYDLLFPVLIALILYFVFHYAVEKRVRCEIN